MASDMRGRRRIGSPHLHHMIGISIFTFPCMVPSCDISQQIAALFHECHGPPECAKYLLPGFIFVLSSFSLRKDIGMTTPLA